MKQTFSHGKLFSLSCCFRLESLLRKIIAARGRRALWLGRWTCPQHCWSRYPADPRYVTSTRFALREGPTTERFPKIRWQEHWLKLLKLSDKSAPRPLKFALLLLQPKIAPVSFLVFQNLLCSYFSDWFFIVERVDWRLFLITSMRLIVEYLFYLVPRCVNEYLQ